MAYRQFVSALLLVLLLCPPAVASGELPIAEEMVSVWSIRFHMLENDFVKADLKRFGKVVDLVRGLGENEYAGMYFAKDYTELHVNVLAGHYEELKGFEKSDVHVHSVNHTMEELEEAAQTTRNHQKELSTYGVWYAQVDVSHNRIVIILVPNEKTEGLGDVLAMLGIDEDLYAIYIHDGSYLLT